MKFLQLFGKSATPPIRHVRQSSSSHTPASAAAEDTARKIDAIESEISAELNARPATESAHADSDALLAQHIDEACLLHASRQPRAAEVLLLNAIAQANGAEREPQAWLMLLELASIAGSQPRFEELALRYAQRFETSPPQWRSGLPVAPAPTPAAESALLAFRGKLLGSSAPTLDHFAQMAQTHAAVRIDLDGVTEADVAGCRLLLNQIERWLSEARRVDLLPAPALVALLRAQLDSAPAASDDSAWRLLIELLRASDANAYEEACIAYSITHEVSPPAPLLPQPGLPTPATKPLASSALPLPAEITYPVDALLEALRVPMAQRPSIVLDGSRLQLIEFNATAPLLAGLARLADGKPVEWRDMSYLVSTLLQLIGGAGHLRIINRKP